MPLTKLPLKVRLPKPIQLDTPGKCRTLNSAYTIRVSIQKPIHISYIFEIRTGKERSEWHCVERGFGNCGG
jgi:hypothetical protein